MPKTTPAAKKTPAQPPVKPSVPAPSSDPFSRPEDVADPDYDPKTDITYDDPRYLDLAEPEINRRKGGGIPDEDMLAATVYCKALQGLDVGKEFVRCLGSFKCDGLWVWPRRKDRIMKHISTCQHIPASLRQSSSKKQGDKAPAAMLEKRKAEEDEVDKQTEQKVSKKHRSGVGVVEKGERSPSLVLDLARDAGRKELKEILDNDVVMLVCVAGLPPRIADLPQWRTLLNHATRGLYKPASKDVLRDNHIPATASWVRKKQMEYLKTQWNLTGTYDGSTTRRPQSIYTFHVTDSHRRTFLIEGDESSTVSHTAEYISSIHQRVRASLVIAGSLKHLTRVCSRADYQRNRARSLRRPSVRQYRERKKGEGAYR